MGQGTSYVHFLVALGLWLLPYPQLSGSSDKGQGGPRVIPLSLSDISDFQCQSAPSVDLKSSVLVPSQSECSDPHLLAHMLPYFFHIRTELRPLLQLCPPLLNLDRHGSHALLTHTQSYSYSGS